MNNPLLTIVIPAYNAEKYISETIESILKQEVDFNFEIFISDDCSTDNTYNICKEYSEKYNFINVIKQNKNIGMTKNQYFVITYPKTKYVAYIDSDDIYYDQNYLSQQVEILEKNPDVELAFSNIISFNSLLNEENVRIKGKKIPPTKFNLHDYLKNTYTITNSTIVFRSSSTKDIPSFYTEYFQFDWLFHIHHGLKGNFYFNNVIGVKYRIHSENATNNKNLEKILTDAIKLVYFINSYLPSEYHRYFKHPLYEMNQLSFFYLKNRKISKFLHWYFKWLKAIKIQKINFRDQFWYFRESLKNIKN